MLYGFTDIMMMNLSRYPKKVLEGYGCPFVSIFAKSNSLLLNFNSLLLNSICCC